MHCNIVSEARDKNILNNRNLNSITRTIRDAVSRLTQRPTINWIPAILEYRVTTRQTRLQREAYNLIEYTLQLTQNTFREQTRMKEQMARHYNEQAYNDASQQTKDQRQLHQTDGSRRKLMSMPSRKYNDINRD